MASFSFKYLISSCFFYLFSILAIGQQSNFKYVVFFEDKIGTNFTLENPSEFMSEMALKRRERFEIQLVENDLPVSQAYIKNIEDKGYTFISQSNWLNAILISADEDIEEELLEEEDYIKNVLWVSKSLSGGRNELSVEYSNRLIWQKEYNYDYGYSNHQINMLNGAFLHEHNWSGEDMLIGVLDAGFSNVPQIEAFDKMFHENRLIATYDFVDYDENAFESSGHGTSVLSLMAGDIEGYFLGTAPKANYVLLKTEDVRSEQLVEEFNYVLGLEYADQLGVDVINTSLGYTRFNHDEMNHSTDDLDGDHLIASLGADIGASKGMLIINSAGNSGNRDWQYISIPSDGDSVLAVGSVNALEQRSAFSGMGNPQFEKVKPNVMAQGENVAIVNVSGEIDFGAGTSFSGPIIAGLATCLWQAFPEMNNIEIMRAIEKSSSQYLSPDNKMGYGIPDFQAAYAMLYQEKFDLRDNLSSITAFPNPFYNSITLTLPDILDQDMEINLINDIGQRIYTQDIFSGSRKTVNLSFSNISSLNIGIYFLQIKTIDEIFMFKMIKV